MKNRGITLVSLVITIIILIILAGLSLNLVLGENGLFHRAVSAQEMQKVAQIKEKLSLEIAAAETDAIIRNEKLEQKQLEDIIQKYGTLQEDKDTIITKDGNYKISLKEIWYGTLSNSGSYTDKVEQVQVLEQEIADLQKKYDDLKRLNDGNGAILESLQTQIETLKTEKEDLEKQKTNLETQLADAQTANSNLTTTLQQEQEKSQQLEQQITDLSNKKLKKVQLTASSGNTYNVTSYENYQDFTLDNFSYTARGSAWLWNDCSGQGYGPTISLSYNNQTGILTVITNNDAVGFGNGNCSTSVSGVFLTYLSD